MCPQAVSRMPMRSCQVAQNRKPSANQNQAWLDNRSSSSARSFLPYGFGAGLSLETSAGIFGISLAYGQELGNPILLQRPKVHFGYVSLF